MIRIEIQNGQIVSGKSWLRHEINSLPDGAHVIQIARPSRTLHQNALYWKWLQIIGDDLGYHKDELHEEFIEAFADIYTIRGLDGKPKQKRMRTSAMSTKQMSRYMDRINQFAAEQGILLPQPESEAA